MFYAGIGSRRAPEEILLVMQKFATEAELLGYTLRSGGADGSDKAFERGIVNGKKEIFKAQDASDWAYEYVSKHCMPNDRSGFHSWKPYVKSLLARNMMQILGRDGDSPVEFVLCWTPSFEYNTSNPGGTGYAIRCALKNSIPVYNLADSAILDNVKRWLEQPSKPFKI